MKSYNLSFSFKGNRNYIHGTDLYKEISTLLHRLNYTNWHFLELNIKNSFNTNLICEVSTSRFKRQEEVANFVLKHQDTRLYGSLTPDPNTIVTTRYPFNEDVITNYASIDYEKGLISYFKPDNKLSTIDVVIGISKFFLENAIDGSAKWFFRTIRFSRPILQIETKRIWLRKASQKLNIVRFEVYIGDELLGEAIGASIP